MYTSECTRPLHRWIFAIGLPIAAISCGNVDEPSGSDEIPDELFSPDNGHLSPQNVQGCTTADWDAGVHVVLNPYTVQPYNNQTGWTHGAGHVTSQIHCEMKFGFNNDDLWIYWDDPYVADQANRANIRVRYQGTNTACKNKIANKGGQATYFDDGFAGSNDNVYVSGKKKYLRLVIGFACIYEAQDIVVVWP